MDQLAEAALHAVLRAESDNHVERAVAALESIASSLARLSGKYGSDRGSWSGPSDPGDHVGPCVNCGARLSLNRANWCFDCFSGKNPSQV